MYIYTGTDENVSKNLDTGYLDFMFKHNIMYYSEYKYMNNYKGNVVTMFDQWLYVLK